MSDGVRQRQSVGLSVVYPVFKQCSRTVLYSLAVIDKVHRLQPVYGLALSVVGAHALGTVWLSLVKR